MKEIMSEKIKVGLVYSPELNYGGVERHITILVEHLGSYGFFPVLYSNVSQRFLENLKSPVSIHAWDSPQELFTQLASEAVDIVHIHSPHSAQFFKQNKPNVPMVQTIHLRYGNYFAGLAKTPWQKIRKFYFDRLERKLFDKTFDMNVFVSKTEMEEAITSKAVIATKAVFIPNSIELPKIIKKKPESENSLVILNVGRLDYQKGQDVLLLAASKLKDHQFEIMLVGEGDYKYQLQDISIKLGIENRVKYLGYRSELSEIYQKANIFLLPSRFETYPYALLEAMSFGLSCIATNVGDIPNIIESEKNGLIIDINAADQLSRALRFLIESPEKREEIGRNARIRVQELASVETTTRQLSILYNNLLG